MNRRNAVGMISAGLALAQTAKPAGASSAGRLKQSVARWCYAKIPIDDLCRQAAEMGITGMDLVAPNDWQTCRKYGITPAMVQGAGTFADGWNRKEFHDKLEKQATEGILRAAAAKVPNMITIAGNRRGMSDAEGRDNCIAGLRRVKKIAEDNGVTICMELLNSKVDHKDHMCDHTAWGVEVIRGVDSPRVKLLYDIYHMQIMEGDLIRTIRENIQYIAHFHAAGVPGRHELDDTQEVNWHTVAKAIADLNFDGYIAQEFIPTKEDPLVSMREAVKILTV
jgi:hydroxypyruvate isomerase